MSLAKVFELSCSEIFMFRPRILEMQPRLVQPLSGA